MYNGLWHQLGDRSQLMAKEQLENGNGGGVILSPRDLSKPKAEEYSECYRKLGAEVLFDPQFYVPHFHVGKHDTYGELMEFRVSASRLVEHSAAEFKRLSKALRVVSRQFSCTAIMSPAVAMHAGQPDELRINLSMLDAAQRAAEGANLPVYATIPVGESLVLSEIELADTLAAFTSRSVDGWILMMDLGSDGFCRNPRHLLSLCRSVLRLAQTGKPVMHGCAGPNCLLSIACGSRAAGVTHSKNMWRLPLSRFEPTEGGGGGAAPVRIFSRRLWSNFVYPDEIVQLPTGLRRRMLTKSEWLEIDPEAGEYFPGDVSQWDANKHLVYVIGRRIDRLLQLGTASVVFPEVVRLLSAASDLHSQIAQYYKAKDSASEHHKVWIAVLDQIRKSRASDFEYLDLIADS